jgi:erythronate-4-phosphate dehydrogenase
MKIVADHKIPFLKGVFEPFAEIVYLPGDKIKKAQLKDADALLTRSITSCNTALLDETSVKLIASATIGDDHIDKEHCNSNSIKWSTAHGCNANAVVQYVFAGLFSVCEKAEIDLRNKTIGIIGAGNIGSKVEKVCRALGLKVLVNDPPREREEGPKGFSKPDQILKEADIITFHVPLHYGGKDKTFHLMDQQFIEKLEKPIILINTSRGPVVDSEALKYGIEKGIIKSTIIDVWEGEPNIDPELLKRVTIGTPHIAGYSIEGKAKATEMVVNTVVEFFDLPIKSWKPDLGLNNEILTFGLIDQNVQQLIQKVFSEVYDIQKDDELLRENPSDFEGIRGSYVFRRENSGYILDLEISNQNTLRILSELGFSIEK